MQFVIPDWPAPSSVRAASSMRTGGISRAPFDSLNLAAHVSDDPAHVIENRRRFHAELQLPAEPFWLQQVHGSAVLPVASEKSPRAADASYTDRSGAVCAVLTADCLPVLFAATDGSKVAAAHAGWRGLAGGVLEATVAALQVPAHRLMAWLGPAIGPRRFEVGDEVRSAFASIDPAAVTAFVASPRGRWQADLYRLARQHLNRLGVEAIYGGDRCTFEERAAFFSYRRDGECGRMATVIWRD